MKAGDLLKAAREFFGYAKDVNEGMHSSVKEYDHASGRFVLVFNDGSNIKINPPCTGMLIDELSYNIEEPFTLEDPLVSACLDGLDFAYFNPSSVLYTKAVWDLKE